MFLKIELVKEWKSAPSEKQRCKFLLPCQSFLIMMWDSLISFVTPAQWIVYGCYSISMEVKWTKPNIMYQFKYNKENHLVVIYMLMLQALQIIILHQIIYVHFLFIVTSPAPWKTKTLSSNFFLVIFSEARTPATATAAVPKVEEVYTCISIAYIFTQGLIKI